MIFPDISCVKSCPTTADQRKTNYWRMTPVRLYTIVFVKIFSFERNCSSIAYIDIINLMAIKIL